MGCSGPLDEHRSTITPTLKSGRPGKTNVS
jgi:hypothetical protein